MRRVSIVSIIALFLVMFVGCESMQVDNKLGREIAAIETIRAIDLAEQCFKSTEGRYGTLRELADKGLIEHRFGEGKPIYDYIFTDAEVTSTTFCIQATRKTSLSAYCDYNVGESGVIRHHRSESVRTIKRGEGKPISEGWGDIENQ